MIISKPGLAILQSFCLIAIVLLGYSCASVNKPVSGKKLIAYCDVQAKKTAAATNSINKMPVVIDSTNKQWTLNEIYNWRSGFWPGIEWYLYEATGNPYWKTQAENSTARLSGILDVPVANHDLGFQLYCSYGNGYRLTANPDYKRILLKAADSLARLFNPAVGTILSWPGRVKTDNWPHNTIIDNMMNLELLFWAAKNGGDKKLYDIAVSHATVTMNHHFRPDHSTYHVAVYNDKTGDFIKGVTSQGFANNSMWARGQAWAIYGFTIAYRETNNPAFLKTAMDAAQIFLKRLPKDHIPFWDFDDPAIPNAPRDASAAAIVASALLELSVLCKDEILQKYFRKEATAILHELASNKYLAKKQNNAFLLHSTGNKPASRDIDVAIIYADYYFLEALIRLKTIDHEN